MKTFGTPKSQVPAHFLDAVRNCKQTQIAAGLIKQEMPMPMGTRMFDALNTDTVGGLTRDDIREVDELTALFIAAHKQGFQK